MAYRRDPAVVLQLSDSLTEKGSYSLGGLQEGLGLCPVTIGHTSSLCSLDCQLEETCHYHVTVD